MDEKAEVVDEAEAQREKEDGLRDLFKEAKKAGDSEEQRRLKGQFWEVKKAEALKDTSQDYVHQLTDVYVDIAGGIEGRPDTVANIAHGLRRTATLFSRLGRDSQKTQTLVVVLTVGLVLLNLPFCKTLRWVFGLALVFGVPVFHWVWPLVNKKKGKRR